MLASRHTYREGSEELDDMESYVDLGNMEGARLNNEMYDAYGPAAGSWASFFARHPRNRRSSPPDEDLTSFNAPPLPPPLPRTGSHSQSHPSLSRQSGVRRPPRPPRPVEFSDFTLRRRSMMRDSVMLPRHEDPEELTVGGSGSIGSSSTRHFFRRSHRNEELWGSPWMRSDDDREITTTAADPLPASTSAPISGLPPRAMSFGGLPSSAHTPSLLEEPILAAPRLRRGGLRAPESLLTRHGSPLVIHMPPSPLSDLATEGDHGGDPPPLVLPEEETAAYPTPSVAGADNERS